MTREETVVVPAVATDSRHVRWPAERFFFAVLDPKDLPHRAKKRQAALGYLFEAELPVPIESVQAVFARLQDGRTLGVGVERELLRDLPEEALTLSSDAAPEWIGPGIDPADVSLLVGDFLPASVRRARDGRAHLFVALVACAFALILLGLERRVRADRRQVTELAAAEERAIADVLGPAPLGVAVEQRRAALTGEARRMEQSRAAPSALTGQDASDRLAEVLHHWPEAVKVSLDTLSITDGAITVRGTAPDAAGADLFSKALACVESLRLDPPQFETIRQGVRFTLRLQARDTGTPNGGKP